MSSFYGVVPGNHTTKWQPEPTFRGTFSILSSCLITMTLCVWTAVHLNIPEQPETGLFTRQTRRKITWLFVGLFAPELIAWTAWEQRREAGHIHTAMRRRLRQGPEPNFFARCFRSSRLTGLLWKEKRKYGKSFYNRHEWTMTHSHYVAMGGFAIDVEGNQLRYLASKRHKQFTVTSGGFQWLAEWGLDSVPNLSEAYILDKSKASGLAKTLVCLQASWFCLQCTVRLNQKLTISLLELNTFAHALCTLIIYILWWNKPLDIEAPNFLTSKATSAYLLVLSMRDDNFSWKSQKAEPLYRKLVVDQYGTSSSIRDHDIPQLNFPGFTQFRDRERFHGHTLYTETRVRKPNTTPQKDGRYVYLSGEEVACLEVAFEGKARRKIEDWHGCSLAIRSRDWPILKAKKNSTYLSFLFAGLCDFLSKKVFKEAWREKNRFQTGVLRFCKVSGPFIHCLLPERLRWDLAINDVQYKFGRDMRKGSYYAGIDILGLFYIFCRVFLVVECFLSMAHLPDSVYQVPRWSQYFPHIG
ncbi:hypothetical protein BDV95DRAFT_568538 [Massariosphaeria phaeospora]|uniref:Uncharacterized protein n=1 Tax=Massariosphaeria phaeospora TaxID=100035 RepID=A0A7C8IBJ0_9PLEO|nr:hypothetical protein BDV95DRAFT_568538 [Massariosphaeria phaeospora]